jgi:uncharacterized C2H2 Zn-finger protein
MQRLRADDVYKKIVLIEKGAQVQKTKSMKEKYKIINLLRSAEDLISYRIPIQPDVLSDDGRIFRCPKCNTTLEAEEGTYADFDLCYVCGQLWKKHNTLIKKVNRNGK